MAETLPNIGNFGPRSEHEAGLFAKGVENRGDRVEQGSRSESLSGADEEHRTPRAAPAADGDEAPTFGELAEENVGPAVDGAIDQDGIKGRCLPTALLEQALRQDHALRAHSREALPSGLDQDRARFERDDRSSQPGHDGGGEAKAAGDVENLVAPVQ